MERLEYDSVRNRIADGDLLLFRPTSLLGRWIASVTRTRYSHAGLAVWWGRDSLMLVDMVFTGGRAVTLSSQVERYPGRIDWFRANPDHRHSWNRQATVEAMIRRAGTPYGFRGLLRQTLSYSFLTRWLVRPSFDDGNGSFSPGESCSQAVAGAYRAGGVDSVLGLGDAWTTPGDLSHSMFFEEQGMLA